MAASTTDAPATGAPSQLGTGEKGATGGAGSSRLREWAPVISVLVAILALFVAFAILFGAVYGRMEKRLRTDLEGA